MQVHSASPSVFAREFAAVSLGDRRREQRLLRIAELCRAAPGDSFPDLAPTTADLTALYRFVGSPAVTLQAILEPHSQQSAIRCADARRVLVVHDTTELSFSGDSRRNLGRLRRRDDQGFLAHVALAVTADGSRRPLGILGAHTWRRTEAQSTSRRADGTRKAGCDYHKQTDKESTRWFRLIDHCQDRVRGAEAIHVADREADAFHLLRDALDHDMRFVFRMARDRVLLDEDDERLGISSEVLSDCRDIFDMEVPLSRRAAKPTPSSTESARDARIAKLAVRGLTTRIARPHFDRESVLSLPVNMVCVHELDPPADVEPVAWVLMTTEPIDTARGLREVVEIYRARWLIEELFKALKTGCAFEKRQLESYETLSNALGIFLPIAWHLLLLRHHARTSPDEPAERVLSPVQIDVIRARNPTLLPSRPTAADALRAVAYLGGHFIKRPPGWQVLGRGLEKLLDLEAGWRLARGLEPDL
jgi:hypothetical protein